MEERGNQHPDDLLRGTPYVIGDADGAADRFKSVASKAASTRERAISAAARIEHEARAVLPQFEAALRSDQVAETYQLEQIDTSAQQVLALAETKRELLELPIAGLVQHIRDDPRVLESLGTYRAYDIADDWARSSRRPREFEFRALHSLVMSTETFAGSYKTAQNSVGLSDLTPSEPWDVPKHMDELASWFESGTGDPVLDSAVVHAWLTHIHPFEDGNGRMARLLATLAVVQREYPPLLIRSVQDREVYLDALASSDEGDILPLYDLFAQTLRRQTLAMEKPNYVSRIVDRQFMNDSKTRYKMWLQLAEGLYTSTAAKLRFSEWQIKLYGYPSAEDFEALEARASSGNGPFFKLRRDGIDEWLLWFGYASSELLELSPSSRDRHFPSIYVSRRSLDPRLVYPFEQATSGLGDCPTEISIQPGRQKPVHARWGATTDDGKTDDAARWLTKGLCGVGVLP